MEDINNELNKIIRKANKQQDFSEVNSLLDDNLEKLKNAKTILSFDMELTGSQYKTVSLGQGQ